MKRILPAILLIGCVGTDVGNPQDEPQVDLTVTLETDFETKAQALTHEGYTIEIAEATLESIELRKSCESAEAAVTQGPFNLNLLMSEEVAVNNQGSGTYCRASLAFGASKKPDERWLYVEGTLPNDNSFTIKAVRSELFIFNGRNNFVVDAEGTSLNLRFDVIGWLKTVELPDESPLVISEDSNVPLYQQFRQALKRDAKLLKDNRRDPLNPDWVPVADITLP